MLDVHNGEYAQALHHIEKAKSWVYDELWAHTGYHDFSARNYTSAMKTLAKSEMLHELSEVIRCKYNNTRNKTVRLTYKLVAQTRTTVTDRKCSCSIERRGNPGMLHVVMNRHRKIQLTQSF